jgi:hypothetical protein
MDPLTMVPLAAAGEARNAVSLNVVDPKVGETCCENERSRLPPAKV